MAKIVMALTQVDHYIEHPEVKTGVWLEEATNFYDIVTKAGNEVVFASTAGGEIPVDPHSLNADEKTLSIADSDGFQNGMKNSAAFSKLNPAEYDALYFCGGHGAMWDFPDNKELLTLAQKIYQAGGYIASVCHGEAGLVGLKAADGSPLVKGVKINGFTNEEERMNGTDHMVPLSPEDELIRLGAEFVKGAPFTEFAANDKRFITGQNPMSSEKVAVTLVNELNR